MTQGVGRDVAVDAGFTSPALDDLPETLACQPLTGTVEKDKRRCPSLVEMRPGDSEVASQFVYRRRAERHDPLLAALAESGQVTDVKLQVSEFQGHQFRDTQPRGIKDFQHGPVTYGQRGLTLGTGQQRLDIVG